MSIGIVPKTDISRKKGVARSLMVMSLDWGSEGCGFKPPHL